MYSTRALVTAQGLNNAFISKTDTNAQAISSNLSISGGQLTLKNSVFTDNANAGYLRIDPQGNIVVIYDGVNNQELRVYSSSGSEAVSLQAINGGTSYGLIDVLGVDHLKIMGNTGKKVVFGGEVEATTITSRTGLLTSLNPSNTLASLAMSWINNDPRLRIGGSGVGSSGTLRVQGVGDTDRMTIDSGGHLGIGGKMTISGNQLIIKGAISSSKIDLYPDNSDKYVLGIESNNMSYGNGSITTANIGHKFYSKSGELIANIGIGGTLNSDRLDSEFKGNMSIAKNVAIGTSTISTDRELVIQQSGQSPTDGLAILANGATNAGGFIWAGTGGLVIDSKQSDGTGSKNLHLRVGGNDALFISSTNRYVGVGTTSPSFALDVVGGLRTQGAGTTGAIRTTDTSSGRTWGFGVWGNRLEFYSESGGIYNWSQLTSENGKWRFGGYADTAGELVQVTGDMFVRDQLRTTGDVLVGDALTVSGNSKFNSNIVMGTDSVKHHKNLATYSNNSNTSAGAFIIDLPFGFISTMMTVTIRGYFYNSTSPFELVVGFYPYEANSTFINTGYINTGSNKLNVRLARRVSTGKVSIILGDEGSSYNYPKLIITDFIQGYGSISDSYGDGWSISQLTSLSDFDLISTVSDKSGFWHSGNDGSGSGLDADLLDGLQSGQFLRSDVSGTLTGILNINSTTNPALELRSTGGGTPHIDFSNDSSTDFDARIILTGDDTLNVDGVSNTGFKVLNNTVWHAGNDGAGSGLDADLLDGLNSTQFVRSDTSTNVTGTINFLTAGLDGSGATGIKANPNGWSRIDPNGSRFIMPVTSGSVNSASSILDVENIDSGWYKQWSLRANGDMYVRNNIVWHAGNDGSGSGLDADLLDGIDSSGFLRKDISDSSTRMKIFSTSMSSQYDYSNSPISIRERDLVTNTQTDDKYAPNLNFHWGGRVSKSLVMKGDGHLYYGTYSSLGVPPSGKIWHSDNDGADSSLDADLVDGLHASQFVRSDISTTSSGDLTINKESPTIKLYDNNALTGSYPKIEFDSTNNQGVQIRFNEMDAELLEAGYGLIIEKNSSNTQTSNKATLTVEGNIYSNGYKVWTAGNDGAGSGLDADLFDGLNSTQFLRSDASDTLDGNLTVNGTVTVATGGVLFPSNPFGGSGDTAKIYLRRWGGTEDQELVLEVQNDANDRVNIVSNGNSSLVVNGNTVWNAGNDGSGSGLDADLLDGLDSSKFIRSDTSDTMTGILTIDGQASALRLKAGGSNDHVYMEFYADSQSQATRSGWFGFAGAGSNKITISNEMSGNINFSTLGSGIVTINENKIWHQGNDGSGSGLDADLLDGLNSSQLIRSDTSQTLTGSLTINPPSGNWIVLSMSNGSTVNTNRLEARWTSNYDRLYFAPYDEDAYQWGREFSYSFADNKWSFDTALSVQGSDVWHAGNDGAGSGLDADLLDGLDSSKFLRSDTSDTMIGALTIHKGGTTIPTSRALMIRDADGAGNAWMEIWSDATKRAGLLMGNPTDGWKGMIEYDASISEVGIWVNAVKSLTLSDSTSGLKWKGDTVWHAGNDGAGSGLDADLLDGIDSTGFLGVVSGGTIDVNAVQGTKLYAGTSGTWSNRGPTGHNGSALLSIHTHSGDYHSQLWFDTNGDNIYHRTRDAGTIRAWRKIWHEGNDGSGSGLDADLLDGLNSGSFMRSDVNTSTTGTITIGTGTTSVLANQTDGSLRHSNSNGYIDIGPKNTSYAHIYTDRPEFYFNKELKVNGSKVWTAGNDGSGSGLDADLLDGLNSTQFLRSDTSSTITGTLTATNVKLSNDATDTFNNRFALYDSGATSYGMMLWNSNGASGDWATMIYGPNQANRRISFGKINTAGTPTLHSHVTEGAYFDLDDWTLRLTADAYVDNNKIWHAGNDGAGSGLDADLLDGNHKDWIRDWNNLLNKPSTFAPSAHDHTGETIKNSSWYISEPVGYGAHAEPLNRMENLIIKGLRSEDNFRFKAVTDVQYVTGNGLYGTWSTTSWQNAFDGRTDTAWNVDYAHRTLRFIVDIGTDWNRTSGFAIINDWGNAEVNYYITVESSVSKSVWNNRVPRQLAPAIQSSYFPSVSDTSQDRYYRFTLEYQMASGNNINIRNIMGVTTRPYTVANGTGLPIYWDYDQNTFTQNKLAVNQGTALRELDVNGSARVSTGSIYSPSVFQFLSDSSSAQQVKAGSLAITSSYSNNAPSNGLYVQDTIALGTTSTYGKLNIVTSKATNSGIQIDGVKIDTVINGGDIAIRNLNQLRFGNSDAWDWNAWAGIKYDNATTSLFIGGPASTKFNANGSPPLINVMFDGIAGVAIGQSTAPRTALEVNGDISMPNGKNIWIGNNGDTGDRLRLHHVGADGYLDYGTGNMYIRRGTTSFLTLTSDGKLGIGTTSPDKTVDISGTLEVTGLIYSPASNSAAYQIGDDSQIWDINVVNTMGIYGVQNSAVGGLKLGSTGPTLYGTGNMLGIGTTSPAYTLDVNGTAQFNGDVRIKGTNELTFSDYGGGFFMQDTTWIRTFGSKSFYHNTGIMRTDGTLQVGNAGAYFNADSAGTVVNPSLTIKSSGNPALELRSTGTGTGAPYIDFSNDATVDFDARIMLNNDDTLEITGVSNTGFIVNGSTVWHAGNDGAGSGLDADLFDGVDSSRFVYGDNSSASTTVTDMNAIWKSGFYEGNNVTNAPSSSGWFWMINTAHQSNSPTYKYNGQIAFANKSSGSPEMYIRSTGGNISTTSWGKVWHDQNDGAGSGLDADLLDGIDSSKFMRNDIGTYATSIDFKESSDTKWKFSSSSGTLSISDSGNTTRLSIQQDGLIKAGSDRVKTSWDSYDTNNGYKTISTSGWYRIASNAGTRAHAKITLLDISSARHHAVTMYAGIAYNNVSKATLSIISNTYYGGAIGAFGIARYLTNGTYDTQYLDIYINATSSVRVIIEDNDWVGGWTPENFISVSGTPPTGYTETRYGIDGDSRYGEMHVAGGRVWHDKNLITSTSAPSGTPKTGTIWVQY